jgi:tetratricopeptide (TPR) repeat protein
MDKMFKTGLIEERVIHGEGICSFADILVRDVVYEEVSPLKRKKLHGVVGSALEQVYAEKIDEHFGELAPHFLESGNKDKALDFYLKAAEKASRIYANGEAASYFRSALGLLEGKEGETRERARVLERLGDIENLVGKCHACLKHWNDALLLWEQIHEKEIAPRLHRKMAHVLWENIGDAEKAIDHQDKALGILETEPESVELARLYDDMAHMYWRIGNTDKARPWAEKALEFAKKMNDYEIIATSCLSLGTIFNMIGDTKKAVEFTQTALEIALDNNYMETAIRAYNNLAVVLPPEENERSIGYLEKGYDLAKKTGDIHNLSWIGTNLAGNYRGAGDVGRASSLTEESVALDRKTGNQNHLTMSLNELGNEYQVLGEWDKSEKCLTEAFNIAQGLKDYQAVATGYGSLFWLHYFKGEYAEAREVVEKGYEAMKKTGDKMMQWWYSYWITDTCIELGEIEKTVGQIDDLYNSALKVEAKTSNKYPIAYAKRLKAKLLRTQGKWEESIDYFEKSLQDFEALNAKRWNVYEYAKWVLSEYAQVYLERDQEGDKEKARDLLNQALGIFQKMGARKDIEKVEAKLLYIETGKVTLVPKPTELVSTGYADIDKLLCGGIRSSSAVVLSSPSCNEKDSLIKSFLKTGAEKGEVAFYLTTSARAAKALAEEFQSGFYLFVCNPQADAIAESSPNVFKLKGVESLTEISIALTSAIHKLDPSLKGPRRACIEIVSDVLLQHHAVQTRKWLTAVTTELTSAGFTILAVVDPQMHPPEELHAILGLFDGEINIYEKGTEKLLRIKRMSNQEYLEDELLLTRERAR